MEQDSIFKRLPFIFVLSSMMAFVGYAVSHAQNVGTSEQVARNFVTALEAGDKAALSSIFDDDLTFEVANPLMHLRGEAYAVGYLDGLLGEGRAVRFTGRSFRPQIDGRTVLVALEGESRGRDGRLRSDDYRLRLEINNQRIVLLSAEFPRDDSQTAPARPIRAIARR